MRSVIAAAGYPERRDEAGLGRICFFKFSAGNRAGVLSVLFEQVPPGVRRVLDLGTGDGRLLALLRRERPDLRGVGLDVSEVMLNAERARFEGEEQIELVAHDMVNPLPELGRFDAVVSSMAIHHLEHDRKRELYAEVSTRSSPAACSRTSSMWRRRRSGSMSPSLRRSASL
jgi:SAM-dependent methyltransferase